MPGPVQPYLFFEGRCEEALAFYEKAIGAERGALMRYSENPEPPRADTLVAHAADLTTRPTGTASHGMISCP